MSVSLTNNRCQPAFGAFIIFLYALYGAYISSLYILDGDKGSRPSAIFFIFIIVLLLLLFTNLSKLLMEKTIKANANLFLLLFLIYMILRLLFEPSEIQSYYGKIMIFDIGKNFIAGFIAFSILKSRITFTTAVKQGLQSTKLIYWLSLLGALVFLCFMFYFIKQFLGELLNDIGKLDFSTFKSVSNDYYQDFGDYITIAYCCLIVLQVSCSKRDTSFGKYIILLLVLSLEAVLAFICLQAVDSNKSVLTIFLMLIFVIYYLKQKPLLINNGRINLKSLIIILSVLICLSFFYPYFVSIDISQMRISDYGKSSSVFENSSLLSRWEIARDYFMRDFLINPVFGNPTTINRMHSSVLSILTEFGFIGSLFLLSFITIKTKHLYGSRENEPLKAIAISILFVSVIATWFATPTLCFLCGALYTLPSRGTSRLTFEQTQ